MAVIGLSTYREQARWGVWDQKADLLTATYVDSVRRAGGVPVLLPTQERRAAEELIVRLDGLVVTGGADVDPIRYDEEPDPRTVAGRAERDEWELALLDAADRHGLPVLGICRGMQLMAVHAGGSLHQHVPDVVGHEEHSPTGPTFGNVEVTTAVGSRLRGLVGESVWVGCHHHQSVRRHPGLVASAHALDGSLEGIEGVGDRFRLGVQWHPETRDDAGLFAGLVAAASAYPAP